MSEIYIFGKENRYVPMNNIVTQRFVQCVQQLIDDHKVKSMRQFALSLEYLPQGMSEMVNGRRDVTIELLRKAVEKYDINSDFVFSGRGKKFLRDENPDFRVLSIVTDASDKEYIVHVPVAAQAGYTDQFINPEFIKELPSYNLPYDNIRGESYRSFDIDGSSMEPTLQHGDKVVCSFIEPQYWKQAIKDGQVYVIITSDSVVVKRVINRIRTRQCLDLVSDNSAYPIAELPVQEIREVWWVRLRITPYLDRPLPDTAELQSMLEQLSTKVNMLTDKR